MKIIIIYIYISLNEMSKNEITKFSNFISNIIFKLLKNISFLVMIGNIISLIRVWLVLSLNFVLLYLIVDFYLNKWMWWSILLHYKVFNVHCIAISILFITPLDYLFIFQTTVISWRLILFLFFFLHLFFIILYVPLLVVNFMVINKK